jgi:hypothetical protein
MRKRKRFIEGVKICQARPGYIPIVYQGVRSQRVADAIVDCRNIVRMDRLEMALKVAVKQGFIHKDEIQQIRKRIKNP